jgi:hypothetical protein
MSRRLAAALLLCCAGAAHAGAPALESQWIAAATRAVEYGRAHGMPISLEIQVGDGLPGHTPIGLASENGFCTLVVSARDNRTADKLTSMVAPELLDLFLEGAAIHELGHCHRRLNGYPHNERLLPIVAWIKPVRDWFTRRIRTEEVYADMLEVAWLARHHPQRFHAVVEQIVKVRTRFREPKHDTLPWLQAALAQGPTDGPGTLFALADRLMERHR